MVSVPLHLLVRFEPALFQTLLKVGVVALHGIRLLQQLET